MKKLLLLLTFSIFHFPFSIIAAPPIFSTSSDWEALTGARYSMFTLRFGRDNSIGTSGMELYFLDGFPCIGETGQVFTWVSPSTGTFNWDRDARLRIGCIYRPNELRFAFRKIRRNSAQGRADGYLVCIPEATGGSQISIRLETCEEREFK